MPFWKKKKTPVEVVENVSPSVLALRNTISKQRKSNPHLRAQITAKDISLNLMEMMNDDKGVHIESALAILGSLAGFSTVYGMVKRIEDKSLAVKMPEVAIAELKTGKKLYMGDFINRRIFQDQTSVFSLAAGIAQHLGAEGVSDFRDYLPLLEKAVNTYGTPEFGIPDIPPEHRPNDLPINYVKHLFSKFLPVLSQYELPEDEFHAAFGFAIQNLITEGKDVIDPKLALNIVMECAVPMSKVDPNEVLA